MSAVLSTNIPYISVDTLGVLAPKGSDVLHCHLKKE